MKHMLIIGDSHTSKLSYTIKDYFKTKGITECSEYSNNNTYVEYEIVKNIENDKEIILSKKMSKKSIDISYDFINKETTACFSSHPGRSAYNFNYNNYPNMLDWNHKNSLIIPWLGYIDIKNWLPQKKLNNKKSAKEVVEDYVNKTLNAFPNAKILFMEPLPQFIMFIQNGWANPKSDPNIDFEERYEQHYKFLDELYYQCKINNLSNPINIRNILGEDMINHNWQHKKIPLFLNDHMLPQYYQKIIEYIIEKT
mgnify:FL=1|jgi:hypothetical protein